MKKMRNLAKYGFGAILLLGSQALLAQQRYSAQVVETDRDFIAYSLNDNGVMVGAPPPSPAMVAAIARIGPVYRSTRTLFLPITTASISLAEAINSSGVAVGFLAPPDAYGSATIYYPNPIIPEQYSAVPIFRKGMGVSQSEAENINDIGWVVGNFFREADAGKYAFVWVPNSGDRTQGTVYPLPCSGRVSGNYGTARTITDGSANAIGGECNRKPYVWIYGVDVDLTSWLPTSIQVPVTGSDPPMTSIVSRGTFLARYTSGCSVVKITNNWKLIVSCTGNGAGASFITQGEAGLQQSLVQFSLGPKTRYDRPPARAYNSLTLTDINEAGCVVGHSSDDVVFSYCNGGFSHLDLPAGLRYGPVTVGARNARINNNGQILVNSRNSLGRIRPVLFTPVP
jgi:hypothetical protein